MRGRRSVMSILGATEAKCGLIEIPRRNSTRHLDITELISRRQIDRRRHFCPWLRVLRGCQTRAPGNRPPAGVRVL